MSLCVQAAADAFLHLHGRPGQLLVGHVLPFVLTLQLLRVCPPLCRRNDDLLQRRGSQLPIILYGYIYI